MHVRMIKGRTVNNHIIVRDIHEKSVNSIGLSLGPDANQQSQYQVAEVLSSPTDMMDIKKGDRVYYAKARSFKMLLEDGTTVTVVRYVDIVYVE